MLFGPTKQHHSALLGTYHIENPVTYVMQYIIFSTNVFITSCTNIFLSFQDGDILYASYIVHSVHT